MGGSLKGVLSVVLCGNWFSDCLYGTKHFQAASGLTRLRQPENQNRTATACRPIAHSIERYHLTKCQQAPQHSITQFSGCLCLSALRQPETQKKRADTPSALVYGCLHSQPIISSAGILAPDTTMFPPRYQGSATKFQCLHPPTI